MMTNCALDILSNSLMRWISCIWHKFQGSRERRSLRASVKIPAQWAWHMEILPPSIFSFFKFIYSQIQFHGPAIHYQGLTFVKKRNHEMSGFGKWSLCKFFAWSSLKSNNWKTKKKHINKYQFEAEEKKEKKKNNYHKDKVCRSHKFPPFSHQPRRRQVYL